LISAISILALICILHPQIEKPHGASSQRDKPRKLQSGLSK